MDDRAAAAHEAVLTLESRSPAQFKSLAQSIANTRKAGIHNVQSAVERLREISDSALSPTPK